MTDFERVERAIEATRNGRFVIMVDDEDRENEGDLVIAAEHCNAEKVNFMCKEGRGLVCLPLTEERVEELGLPMMVPTDPGSMGTAFTISIEAREGVTTGISAADRAQTIRVAADPRNSAKDIVSPGHIFPLRAQPGGVLVRSGHTEGSVDLARLAGCQPAAVICEIMHDDGTMARMDDLERLAEKYDLPIVSIAELIAYRLQRESLVEEVSATAFSSTTLGIKEGSGWTLRLFRSRVEPVSNFLTLSKGDLEGSTDPVLLRAQKAEVLGDVFGFDLDDSKKRLRLGVQRIEEAGRGVFLYVLGEGFSMTQLQNKLEGRDESSNSLKARESGFREFGLGAQVLKALGVRSINVLTDNPRKIVGLEGFDIEVAGSVPLGE